jgi:hypothetical protein
MRRAQDRVAPVEPLGGASVQRAVGLREQRAQHGLADQRMGEDQLPPVGTQKARPQQAGHIKGWIADQRQ